jgi:hypothetical protein
MRSKHRCAARQYITVIATPIQTQETLGSSPRVTPWVDKVVTLTHPSFVTLAHARAQTYRPKGWIPAYARMTNTES